MILISSATPRLIVFWLSAGLLVGCIGNIGGTDDSVGSAAAGGNGQGLEGSVGGDLGSSGGGQPDSAGGSGGIGGGSSSSSTGSSSSSSGSGGSGGGIGDCTLWDYNASAPCPQGVYNCDCANGCGSTNCGGSGGSGGGLPPPGVQTKFHHTTTASVDGGKSLVLCPGQTADFDSCDVGSVNIPRHGDDNGRETYWNMFQEPQGDIVCTKGGNSYTYPAHSTTVYGNCS